MDPISAIVTALVSGAAAGLKPTAQELIKDAYEGIRGLIKRKLNGPVLEKLEANPSSEAARTLLTERLKRADAGKDEELLKEAGRLLELVKQHAPHTPEVVGVKLGDIEAASLTLDDIVSSGSGVLIDKGKINGDIKISGVRAGVRESDANTQIAAASTSAILAAAKTTGAGVILDGVKAHDILIADGVIQHITQQYFVSSGVVPYQDYLNGVLTPSDLTHQGTQNVNDLRKKLLRIKTLPEPVCVTVRGTLFPCALLTAGWWDRQEPSNAVAPKWHDNIQKWLFSGFDLWGPSWDFTWDTEHNKHNSYVIAQLGYGDEADSIPVLIPQDEVGSLNAFFQENWGGGEVEITGLLGHRSQFVEVHEDVHLVGGLLDYCLWIDYDNKNHSIVALNCQTDLYSGYLWKCVTPKAWYTPNMGLSLNQVYFIWEHTNFCDQEAIEYNLDSLRHKEEYISRLYGSLVLLQKSSRLVPGEQVWNTREFYDVFCQRKRPLV